MVNTKVIKAQMILQDIPVKRVLEELDLTERQWYYRMEHPEIITAVEVKKLSELLNTDVSIFFTD